MAATAAHVNTGMPTRALVALVFLLGLVSLSCAARLPLSKQKFEVQKHLKRLNKPAVKTIKVPISLSISRFVCCLGAGKMEDTERKYIYFLWVSSCCLGLGKKGENSEVGVSVFWA